MCIKDRIWITERALSPNGPARGVSSRMVAWFTFCDAGCRFGARFVNYGISESHDLQTSCPIGVQDERPIERSGAIQVPHRYGPLAKAR